MPSHISSPQRSRVRSVQTSYPAAERRAPYQAVIALSSGLAWLMKTTLRSARGVIAVRLDAAPAGLPLARCDSLFFIGAIVEGSYRGSNPASSFTTPAPCEKAPRLLPKRARFRQAVDRSNAFRRCP